MIHELIKEKLSDIPSEQQSELMTVLLKHVSCFRSGKEIPTPAKVAAQPLPT